MALLENMKIFSIISLILINECLSFPINPQFVMLNERVHQASTDFMPMLFHDPRFPQKRPQVLFVPVERKPRPQMQTHDVIDEDESQIIPNDNTFLNPEPLDDHHDHHHHHHYHHNHDHYDTDQEQDQE